MVSWGDESVLVTGGSGFLGQHVLAALRDAGAKTIRAPRSSEYDLRDIGEILRLLKAVRPTLIIHLAARVGGIGANHATPGTFFSYKALMGIELMEQARLHDVRKCVALRTVCASPQCTPVPFRS